MNKMILRDFDRVPPEIVQQASGFQAAILADVNGRRGAMHGRIAALRPRMKLAGPALTVEVRPGDNLMIHAAMAIAKPGDVLVIDGAVRDSLEIDEMDFPVFSVGTNPNGPTKNVAGRIGYPISCGGVTVRAGDLVVADADGVFIGAREDVPTHSGVRHVV